MLTLTLTHAAFTHPRAAAVAPRATIVAAVSSWSDLESLVPSSVDLARPAVYHADTVSAAALAGKTVLFRDANGWCPYAERVWLALELKVANYVTCLVHHRMPADYGTPGEERSLPRVQWADGSMDDGSSIGAILERIEQDYPHPPALFPKTSVSVDYVRDSFNRFDGIMPRFTLPSSLVPYVLACKIQRAGSFNIEECELGELVPKYKYDVCLEEVDEILEEYDGPFIAGKSITAADIWWAPFLERLAAYLPLLYPTGSARPSKGRGRFEALSEWYDAMDELVPCYSCRIKGRARTWQSLLRADPYLDGQTVDEPLPVPDLPTGSGFDADAVWGAYADGRAHVAPTAAQEAAAVIMSSREELLSSASEACGFTTEVCDAALREVCQALACWDGSQDAQPTLSADALSAAAYLDATGLEVPRDLGVIPSEALRVLVDRPQGSLKGARAVKDLRRDD